MQVTTTSREASVLSTVATSDDLKALITSNNLLPNVSLSPYRSAKILKVIEYSEICSLVDADIAYGWLEPGSIYSLHYVLFLKEGGIWKVAYFDQYGPRKTDWSYPAPAKTCSDFIP